MAASSASQSWYGQPRAIDLFGSSVVFARRNSSPAGRGSDVGVSHVAEIYACAGIARGATRHTLRHTCETWQLDKGYYSRSSQRTWGKGHRNDSDRNPPRLLNDLGIAEPQCQTIATEAMD